MTPEPEPAPLYERFTLTYPSGTVWVMTHSKHMRPRRIAAGNVA